MKKITVLGSHGVGKTTLCYSLCFLYKQLKWNVKLVHETARSCPFPINENTTFEAQLWNCLSHLKKELETKARGFDLCICDRSSIDPFVYLRANDIVHPLAQQLEEFAMAWMNSYDLIIYITPDEEQQLETDGTRSTDLEFRQRVQESFDYYVDNFPVSLKNKMQHISSSEIFSDVKVSRAVRVIGNRPELKETSDHLEFTQGMFL